MYLIPSDLHLAFSSTAPSRSMAPLPAKTTILATKQPLNSIAGTPSWHKPSNSTMATLAETFSLWSELRHSTQRAPQIQSSTAAQNNSLLGLPKEPLSIAASPTVPRLTYPTSRTSVPSSSTRRYVFSRLIIPCLYSCDGCKIRLGAIYFVRLLKLHKEATLT